MIAVVLDTSILSGFAQAERLGDLERVLTGIRVLTTTEVLDEVRDGVGNCPSLAKILGLPWLTEVHLRGRQDMAIFAEYCRRLGSGTRGDVGEATVLAYAERYEAVAVLDDKAGRTVAKERGVKCRGSLWVIASGITQGVLSIDKGVAIVDELRGVGVYLPCTGAEFPGWAHQNGLLVASGQAAARPRRPSNDESPNSCE